MFDTYAGYNDLCDFDENLEIRDGSSGDSPLMAIFCGSNIPRVTLQSTQNSIWLR